MSKSALTGKSNPRRNRRNWRDLEVLKRLEQGEELSTLEQVANRGGWRLAATIHRLKQQGHDILSYQKPGFRRCAFYTLVLGEARQFDLFAGLGSGADGGAPRGEGR